MVSGVNGSLLSYLNASNPDGSGSAAGNLGTKAGTGTNKQVISHTALDRVAGSFKMAHQARTLEAGQATLAKDLRSAMSKAGVKLEGNVDFSLGSDGTVKIKGSDADQAAVKSFLKADTSEPSFVHRIASQAKQAMDLSSSIQRGAAMSQAAQYRNSAAGVMSAYTSLMHNAGATTVVFSVSADSSSLSYPGSLSTQA
ncbi:MAG: hypothetical protein JO006_18465 [Paucibacter sp.]|nr:hypothetical protein [Roseateles sp.]